MYYTAFKYLCIIEYDKLCIFNKNAPISINLDRVTNKF